MSPPSSPAPAPSRGWRRSSGGASPHPPRRDAAAAAERDAHAGRSSDQTGPPNRGRRDGDRLYCGRCGPVHPGRGRPRPLADPRDHRPDRWKVNRGTDGLRDLRDRLYDGGDLRVRGRGGALMKRIGIVLAAAALAVMAAACEGSFQERSGSGARSPATPAAAPVAPSSGEACDFAIRAAQQSGYANSDANGWRCDSVSDSPAYQSTHVSLRARHIGDRFRDRRCSVRLDWSEGSSRSTIRFSVSSCSSEAR